MADASRLKAGDLISLASLGLRIRRLRTALSALGICIGISAIVGVLGITQSSQSDLLAQIDRLGTNLLTVQNGRQFNGGEANLPVSATAMIGHIPAVQHVSATALLSQPVFRTDLVPSFETGGIGVRATETSLIGALDGTVLHGTFLNAASARYPAAVLGFGAAEYLGIDRLDRPTRVWIGGRWFTVIGILERLTLAPEIDQSVLVGWPIAESALGFNGYPTRIYVRVQTDQVTAVDALLAPTANPQNPDQVAVSRPSDALAARLAVQSSSTTLILGLGAIALLVGGVGIANVMFISVLERRSEGSVARWARPAHTSPPSSWRSRCYFRRWVVCSASSSDSEPRPRAYATAQGWSVLIPPIAIWAALFAAVVIGAAAGLYPALRAARLNPTDALRAV